MAGAALPLAGPGPAGQGSFVILDVSTPAGEEWDEYWIVAPFQGYGTWVGMTTTEYGDHEWVEIPLVPGLFRPIFGLTRNPTAPVLPPVDPATVNWMCEYGTVRAWEPPADPTPLFNEAMALAR